MKLFYVIKVAFFAFLLEFGFIFQAFAGGILIDVDTLLINNSRQPFIADLNNILELEFMSDQYIYGRRGDSGYIVFLIEKEPDYKMSGSVGWGKRNFKDDLVFIQSNLKSRSLWSYDIDGIWSDKLYEAIKQYQQYIGFKNPDGIIEKGGLTYRSFYDSDRSLLIAPLKVAERGVLYHLRTRNNANSIFKEGKYEIKYSNIPIFNSDLRYRSFAKPWFNELIPVTKSEMMIFINIIRHLHFTKLTNISFTSKNTHTNSALYLKVNNKIPGLKKIKLAGVKDAPLVFSWNIRSQDGDRLFCNYRYRLLPDTNWSQWSRFRKKSFFYLPKGNHVFEVEGKYLNKDKEWIVVSPSKYNFNLSKPFLSLPSDKIYKTNSEKFNYYFNNLDEIKSLYNNKYAILLGIESFQDRTLSPLPYMKNDVKLVETALSKYNFDITKYVGELRYGLIDDLLRKSINKLEENDFLVIYISSHGFNRQAAGYVAASDCDKTTGQNCLELKMIDQILNPNMYKGKHVLVLLDSCSSGLGVIDKNTNFPERDMVFKRGAIMITAGLEDQPAQMIKNIHSSVFTYFLAKGLEGDADLLKDGVITITELLLYVRYNVAKYTNGLQIPMMGRISGSGEMVF